MGVDLEGYFKIRTKSLKSVLKMKLLDTLVINNHNLSDPFTLSLISADVKTHETKWIPWETVDKKTRSDSSIELFLKLGLAHGMERESKYLHEFIKKSKTLYDLAKPEFGFCEYELAFDPLNLRFDNFLGWLNFFGPESVKKYGKDRLLSSPAYSIEELSDGGVFLQVSYGPGMIGFPEEKEIEKRNLSKEELDMYDQEAQLKKIRKHLGFQERSVKPK